VILFLDSSEEEGRAGHVTATRVKGPAALQAAFLLEGKDLKTVIANVRDTVPALPTINTAWPGAGLATAIRQRQEHRPPAFHRDDVHAANYGWWISG
jgi:hypothetical protein